MSAAIAVPIALGIFEAIAEAVKMSQQDRAIARQAALDYAKNPTAVARPDLAANYGAAFDRATGEADLDSPPLTLPDDDDKTKPGAA